MNRSNLSSLFKKIKLFIMDVDGVLTDGGIFYDQSGQVLRCFHAHDGQGIINLKASGVICAIITAYESTAVEKRAVQLGIEDLHQGVKDKSSALQDILKKYAIKNDNVLYIGDDLGDLPVLKVVGLPVAVSNAVPEVKASAKYITRKQGGSGAVREVADLLLQAKDNNSKAVGIIPARYDSTRFPGKPLAMINGYPLVYHVYSQVIKSELDYVIIATDDQRIFDVCTELGCKVVLTSKQHLTGSDRVAEVAQDYDAGLFINIQGDEPLISPQLISEVAQVLKVNPFLDIVTARKKLTDPYEINNPNVVKIVVDKDDNVLYSSRAVIPFHVNRDTHKIYYKHIGIYGYRKEALLRLTALPPSKLEISESLEQLRALENGLSMQAIETNYDSIGVDTPEDLEKVKKLLE